MIQALQILKNPEQLLGGRILEHDLLIRIKQIKRRYGPYIIKLVRPDDIIRIKTVIPFLRIYRHIRPPFVKVFINIDVQHRQASLLDCIRQIFRPFNGIDDLQTCFASGIAEEKDYMVCLDVIEAANLSALVRKTEIRSLRAHLVEGA